MKSGVRHDDLENHVGEDSLVDAASQDHTESNIIEEDDPLAEFEAWLASGAVQIVDKL